MRVLSDRIVESIYVNEQALFKFSNVMVCSSVGLLFLQVFKKVLLISVIVRVSFCRKWLHNIHCLFYSRDLQRVPQRRVVRFDMGRYWFWKPYHHGQQSLISHSIWRKCFGHAKDTVLKLLPLSEIVINYLKMLQNFYSAQNGLKMILCSSGMTARFYHRSRRANG